MKKKIKVYPVRWCDPYAQIGGIKAVFYSQSDADEYAQYMNDTAEQRNDCCEYYSD